MCDLMIVSSFNIFIVEKKSIPIVELYTIGKVSDINTDGVLRSDDYENCSNMRVLAAVCR